MHKILTLVFSVVLLLSCNKGNHKSSPSAAPISNDSVLVEQEQEMTGESVDTILITKSTDGKKHLFYVDFTDAYNLYSQTVGEWDDERIHFAYDHYEDGNLFYEDGFPSRFHYVVSKDKKYIFVAANIQANGSGWTTEYQLFKVDVKTKKTTLIADCAAIEAVSDGFIVAKARCINEGTAQSEAEEIWTVHDEKIDFNGKVVNISTKEYDSEVMEKKFHHPQEEFCLLKGFNSCKKFS